MKKFISAIISLCLIVTTLCTFTLTAGATYYSNQRWDVTKDANGIITKIKYSFYTTDSPTSLTSARWNLIA